MTARNSLHTAGEVVYADDARLSQTAVVAKNGISPRTGVFYAGNQVLLTATASTSPMQVKVAPLHACGSKADTLGTYWTANDGDYLLTIAAAPGSGSRTDVVYIMQKDSDARAGSPDATTEAVIAATSGPLPDGAVRIGPVTVPAGVTKLTDAGVVVTTDCQWTAAAGAPIPVNSATQRDALTPYKGLQVLRLDRNLVETYDGTGWRGAVKTYTPAWTADTTNPNVGTDGSVSGYYVESGEFVDVVMVVKFGTTGPFTQGSGTYALSLPVPASLAEPFAVNGSAIYTTSGNLYAMIPTPLDANRIRVVSSSSGAWGQSVPAAIAPGASMRVACRYRRA